MYIQMGNFIYANYAYQAGINQTRAVTIPYDKGTSLPLVDVKSRTQLLYYQYPREATSAAHVLFK